VGVTDIVAQIDYEISRLKHASALLRGASPTSRSGQSISPFARPAKKRNLTPDGRRRIVEAVRRRWALQKNNKSSAMTGA
jgi:hypothetical protein